MADVNICIIGAGVVGLAEAMELSKVHNNIFLLEKHSKFGQETSSRNSEVIHSGIYYPANSLKASLCVAGHKLLYDYCEQKDIRFNKCGKLIVATNSEEEKQLEGIIKQSKINGVEGAYIIGKEEIAKLEPYIVAHSAIYFPSTGIVDSYGFMKQLETDSINNGVQIAYESEVIDIRKIEIDNKTVYEIEVSEANSSFSFTSNFIINSAGLFADNIAAMVGLELPEYKLHYWKGEYFGISNGKNKLIKHLIYPVPNKNITGLGVHATIDLDGGLKLGPNAIFMDNNTFDYSVSKDHSKEFYNSVSKFLPFLTEGDLHPDQAGIRPKLQKPGDPVKDFVISEESSKGYPGFINQIGIESPGLTASLAIAKHVRNLISIN